MLNDLKNVLKYRCAPGFVGSISDEGKVYYGGPRKMIIRPTVLDTGIVIEHSNDVHALFIGNKQHLRFLTNPHLIVNNNTLLLWIEPKEQLQYELLPLEYLGQIIMVPAIHFQVIKRGELIG